jgi:hypothetical protein
MVKGQVSAELILLLAGLLTMFLIIFSMSNNNINHSRYGQDNLNARIYADKLAANINAAFIAGNGTTATLEIPRSLISNSNYSIDIFPIHHIVQITWTGDSGANQYMSQILTGNISGNLSHISGNLRITNKDGGIVVDN